MLFIDLKFYLFVCLLAFSFLIYCAFLLVLITTMWSRYLLHFNFLNMYVGYLPTSLQAKAYVTFFSTIFLIALFTIFLSMFLHAKKTNKKVQTNNEIYANIIKSL